MRLLGHLSRYLQDMGSQSKYDPAMVLSLTVQNSLTLLRNGDSSIAHASSPRFTQANGEVERGVSTVKNLLTKEKDPAKALLAYRSTPLACKFSPAQLLMGKQIRNSVPLFHTQLNPQWPDLDNPRARESISKSKQEMVFNTRHNAKPLPSIEPGTKVFVKDLQRLGKVIEAASTPRSYKVETQTSTIRRNRAHLTPMPNQQEQLDRPTPMVNQVPVDDKATTPVRKDIPVTKGDIQVPPVTPILATRRKRVIKPKVERI